MKLLLLPALLCLLLLQPLNARTKELQAYFVDVEGGQSTLFVTPAGQSLLVDTGWPGNAYRDANRIVKACKLAGVKKIDYLVITHFHIDHVGGVPQLVSKMPVQTFVDHGPTRENSKASQVPYDDYIKAIGASKHLVMKPGDHLPLKGMDAVVVSADGNVIESALPGAGSSNPGCSGVQEKATDPSENARSLGLVLTLGKLKIVDLGDLTWNKELGLMCPNNKLGTANVFVVSHHGLDQSNDPALVNGLHPQVAIMDNGSKKGGSPAAWDVVKASPGLQDLWQLHFADAGGKEHNVQDPFIANVEEADTGFDLRLTAAADGSSFRVYNSRNKFSKDYQTR